MTMSLSRRLFLKNAAAMSLVTPFLTPTLTQAADVSGYKALVCLFFLGGLDTHDVLLPYDTTSYDQFSTIRGNLLQQQGANRARTNLLSLSPDNAGDFGSRQFALPPEMPLTKALFDTGNAAIVPNVGPLITPTTQLDVLNDAVELPPRLFSHNDQQSVWQTSAPEGAQLGWGGLFADAANRVHANANPAFSTVTGASNDVFLTGQTASPYQLTLGGEPTQVDLLARFERDRGNDAISEERYQILRQHLRPDMPSTTHLIERDLSAAAVSSLDANELFATATENAPNLITTFPTGFFGEQLAAVARTIQVRSALQAQRQVFFVGIGGFDTHSDQATTLPALLSQVDTGISAFMNAMTEMGVANQVTMFTGSDFGRTLAVNGDGTDHGWGSHQLVIGGAVNGNRIYGDVPPPVLDHDFDVGSGRLLPSLAVDQYAATLGRWFGLNDSELAAALPNLANFTDPLPTFV